MVIGVTGGMGCGKSTVSRVLADKLNAPILDADRIAHSAFSCRQILDDLCVFLGNDIVDKNGDVDKKKISDIVFADTAKLEKLNSLIHPFVMNSIREQIDVLSKTSEFIIVDIPLPNDDFVDLSDFIITVWADLDIRIERILTRSNLSRDEVIARIKKQMSQDEYETLADVVIYNNGNVEELINKINNVFEKIKTSQ